MTRNGYPVASVLVKPLQTVCFYSSAQTASSCIGTCESFHETVFVFVPLLKPLVASVPVKSFSSFFNVALRPRKRDGLLGTGTEGKGDERVKAQPRIPPKKDRRDRGPPPEQWKC